MPPGIFAITRSAVPSRATTPRVVTVRPSSLARRTKTTPRPVGGEVAFAGAFHQAARLAPHRRGAEQRRALPVGSGEEDLRAVGREAGRVVGPGRQGRLRLPRHLLQPDAGQAVAVRRERDRPPVGRDGGRGVAPGEAEPPVDGGLGGFRRPQVGVESHRAGGEGGAGGHEGDPLHRRARSRHVRLVDADHPVHRPRRAGRDRLERERQVAGRLEALVGAASRGSAARSARGRARRCGVGLDELGRLLAEDRARCVSTGRLAAERALGRRASRRAPRRSAKMSARWSAGSPRTCSGDM